VNGTVDTEFRLPGGVAGRRRLAAFLSKAGEDLVRINGELISRQEALAHLMWNLLLEGEISMADGRLLLVDDVEQWISVAKFVFTHLDGPAVSVADARGTNAIVRVVFGDADPYPEGEPAIG
jgi:hypothetical protein